MPSWSSIQKNFNAEKPADRGEFIASESRKLLKRIVSNQNRNVITPSGQGPMGRKAGQELANELAEKMGTPSKSPIGGNLF